MPIIRDNSWKEISGHVIEKQIYFKIHVRPIIEYSSPAKDTNNKNVEKVKSVKRKAARFIVNDIQILRN